MVKRALLIMLMSFSLLCVFAAHTTVAVWAANPTATPASPAARATALELQGENFYRAGKYVQAAAAFQQALDIVQEMGDRRNTGVLLSNIGACYEAQRQVIKALSYYSQALSIAKATGNQLGQAQTLTNIGNAYVDQAQYAKALDVFTQSLTLFRRLRIRSAEGVVLNSLGRVYVAQGQYSKALDTFNQSQKISHGLSDFYNEGLSLGNLANIYQLTGQYARALDLYNQSLTLAHKSDDRAGEILTLTNIGALYGAQGQYDRALDSLTKALQGNRDIGNRQGETQTLIDIGGIYTEIGQYDEALLVLTQALEIDRQIGSRADEAVALENIGIIQRRKKDFKAALDTFTQALSVYREIGDRAGEGTALSNLGELAYQQQDYETALVNDKQALVIHHETGSTAKEAVALVRLGNVYEAMKRLPDAIESYRQAVERYEALLNHAALESTIASLLDSQDMLYPYHRLAVLLTKQGSTEEALGYAERGHAILYRTELSSKPVEVSASTDQALVQQEILLRLAVNNGQKTLDTLQKDVSAAASDIQAAQAALDIARLDYQAQLDLMQVRGGLAAQQLSSKVATLLQIQAALPADSTLALYSLDDKGSLIFLVTSTSLTTVELTAPLEDIEAAVNTFATDRHANTNALDTLYSQLAAPLLASFKTVPHHLIIVPDGPLTNVPFAALRGPNGRYLIDDYAISIMPSGTLLALLSGRQAQGKAVSSGLVLAQPDAPGLPRLRNARSEASSVADLLGVKPILNASATDLLKKAPGSQVLHISAHAELITRQPLFSAIYLKDDSAMDGRFEVRQIYGLDLTKGTELVVLSGCNTASGGTGEAFGALTRAFFSAGAPRVVASLWSVDDESTSLLMATFFSERKKGQNDADALRAAMLVTRQKFPEPYFWASFVISGIPGQGPTK